MAEKMWFEVEPYSLAAHAALFKHLSDMPLMQVFAKETFAIYDWYDLECVDEQLGEMFKRMGVILTYQMHKVAIETVYATLFESAADPQLAQRIYDKLDTHLASCKRCFTRTMGQLLSETK